MESRAERTDCTQRQTRVLTGSVKYNPYANQTSPTSSGTRRLSSVGQQEEVQMKLRV